MLISNHPYLSDELVPNLLKVCEGVERNEEEEQLLSGRGTFFISRHHHLSLRYNNSYNKSLKRTSRKNETNTTQKKNGKKQQLENISII